MTRKRHPLQNIRNVFAIRKPQLKSTKKKRVTEKIMMASDFRTDIFDYLLEKEKNQRLKERRTIVSPTNRGRLVDWMFSMKEELHMEEETFQLAVSLVDRSLNLVTKIKPQLQLLGIASLMVARKYEEVDFWPADFLEYCPVVEHRLVYEMEGRLLTTINFSLDLALPVVFLRDLSTLLSLPDRVFQLSLHLCNIAFYKAVNWLPSELANAALLLSCQLTKHRLQVKEEEETKTKELAKMVLEEYVKTIKPAMVRAYDEKDGLSMDRLKEIVK